MIVRVERPIFKERVVHVSRNVERPVFYEFEIIEERYDTI
jgi:hypothetical protein